jgi:uncharacterized protein YjiS (DUF1127 family)
MRLISVLPQVSCSRKASGRCGRLRQNGRRGLAQGPSPFPLLLQLKHVLGQRDIGRQRGRATFGGIEADAKGTRTMLKFIKEAIEHSERRYRAMTDYRMMQEMDERMLRDIGVTRAEIDEAQHKVRWMV